MPFCTGSVTGTENNLSVTHSLIWDLPSQSNVYMQLSSKLGGSRNSVDNNDEADGGNAGVKRDKVAKTKQPSKLSQSVTASSDNAVPTPQIDNKVDDEKEEEAWKSEFRYTHTCGERCAYPYASTILPPYFLSVVLCLSTLCVVFNTWMYPAPSPPLRPLSLALLPFLSSYRWCNDVGDDGNSKRPKCGSLKAIGNWILYIFAIGYRWAYENTIPSSKYYKLCFCACKFTFISPRSCPCASDVASGLVFFVCLLLHFWLLTFNIIKVSCG